MNILHVLDHSLPDIDGYAVRSHAILRGQRLGGMQPAAVTSLWQRRGGPTAWIDGVAYHRTTAPAAPPSDRATRDRLFVTALRDRVLGCARAQQTRVVHAHSPSLVGTAAYLAARGACLPIVYEIRASWEDAAVDQGRMVAGSAEYLAAREAEMRLAQAADAVVAISRGIRADLIERGLPAHRVVLVPNGVDPDSFVPRERDAAVAQRFGLSGKLVIGYFGSFFRFEGLSLLLQALSTICAARDDVRALFVGDGETASALRTEAAALGLAEKVVFTGRVPPEHVARMYSVADVVCYPRARCRLTELTTPLKPLESMSMGKAVVASDVGGHRELMEDGRTAMLFRAGDAADLARALRTAIDTPALRGRLGEAARAEVIATRSWRAIVRRYSELYAALTSTTQTAQHPSPSVSTHIAGEAT